MCGMRARSSKLALAGAIVGMSTSSAFAYLDPGTGSMILQVLLGGLAGLALAGKLYWHKLLSVFGIRQDSSESRMVDAEPAAEPEARRE